MNRQKTASNSSQDSLRWEKANRYSHDNRISNR
jgi:hypothetical protein